MTVNRKECSIGGQVEFACIIVARMKLLWRLTTSLCSNSFAQKCSEECPEALFTFPSVEPHMEREYEHHELISDNGY